MALPDAKAHVLLFHPHRFSSDLDASRYKHRARISRSKGIERERFECRTVRNLIQIDFGVHKQRGHKIGRSQASRGVSVQLSPELVHVAGWHRDTGGVKMAAEFHEQLGHLFERIEQMKGRDAAAGALRNTVFGGVSQDERGPMKSLYQPRRHNAEHAAVPGVAGEYQRGVVFGHRDALTFLQYRFHNLGFRAAAVRIECIELLCERAGPVRIRRDKQLDHIRRGRHAAGRIDTRRDLKSNLPRRRRAALAQTGDLQQRAQSFVLHHAQSIQSMLDDDAILTRQRHDVRHRPDGHQLQERLQNSAQFVRGPVQRLQQSLRQLERDTDAAKIFFRIGAARLIRIEDGQRRRQLGFRQMMVGDDDVDAQLSRPPHHFSGPNARVHADDERHTFRAGALDNFRAHAVALLETIRHMK